MFFSKENMREFVCVERQEDTHHKARVFDVDAARDDGTAELNSQTDRPRQRARRREDTRRGEKEEREQRETRRERKRGAMRGEERKKMTVQERRDARAMRG